LTGSAMTAGGEPVVRLSVASSNTAKSGDQDHFPSIGECRPERHFQWHDGAIQGVHPAKCLIAKPLQPPKPRLVKQA